MRKLKLQVQLSVDGYVAGPKGEMDWLVWDWDDGIKSYVTELTDSVDTILLGRKMTEPFIAHWTSIVMNDPMNPDYPFARKMVDKPKVVFTKSMERSAWDNTTLARGDLVSEVNKLKNREGRDMIVYGGATFVSSLINSGLIDEYHLFINPAIIGKGLAIFRESDSRQFLKMSKSASFDCGITLLRFDLKKS